MGTRKPRMDQYGGCVGRALNRRGRCSKDSVVTHENAALKRCAHPMLRRCRACSRILNSAACRSSGALCERRKQVAYRRRACSMEWSGDARETSVGGDLPAVAPRTFEHGSSSSPWYFPWLLHGHRAKGSRLLKGSIRSGDVHGRHRACGLSFDSAADDDQAFSDAHVHWQVVVEKSLRTKEFS